MDDLHVVLGFVAEAMAAADYGDDDLLAVRVALAEALRNAVRDAHRGDGTKPVRVRHHIDARRVLVEVEDQGDGFDPAGVPDPVAPENRGRRGGRGLLRMRALPDGVRVNCRGDCVTLCKYRSRR
jgi:serine/threonine-protein kinase RsbW